MNKKDIQKIINENDVVVFMKGTKDFPACGFSAIVVQIFKQLNIEFKDLDVLKDQELRQNIKEFSNWPTLPQVYIKQKFIGGSDIIREMYDTQELQKLFAAV
ncbi:MAG: Grx4 family monothiol glutaredoxin [Alphaproteobacteria bacterium]|nr:MAG: Grx4 family monothiol glutaredoxin [Alphaproteobacteria bacterium]